MTVENIYITFNLNLNLNLNFNFNFDLNLNLNSNFFKLITTLILTLIPITIALTEKKWAAIANKYKYRINTDKAIKNKLKEFI